jgi:hypothetical protein
MLSLASGIKERLQQAFIDNGISIDVRSDHIVVESSLNQTEEKIRQIVESSGFCPLIFKNKSNRNFVFTITPYKIPEFFHRGGISTINCKGTLSPDVELSSALQAIDIEHEARYFSVYEVSSLLRPAAFLTGPEDSVVHDRWSAVNHFRAFISPALNQGLAEILSPHVKDAYPILEIGSGIGYTLPENISSQTIRIQPALSECQIFRKMHPNPLYQMSVEGLYNSLIGNGKKIPLFFALNVFDTMPADERKKSIWQISQLQSAGDRLLVMLDTNPCLDVAVRQLEIQYPGHAALPYFPKGNACHKLSLILIPLEFIPIHPSGIDLVDLIQSQSIACMRGHTSQMQLEFERLHREHHLKVIALEDFFIGQIKDDLQQAGYSADIYYHASFTTGEVSKELSAVKQDLIYKSVSDTATVRQWSLDDKNLLNGLNEKALKVPILFNEAFLEGLRKKGQKIFGAEILVIQAAKG